MICKYKTEGSSPKNFSNYQNPIDLFINLINSNINPKEVLTNQTNFKLYLLRNKIKNPKSKTGNQISSIQNAQ